MPLAPGAGGEGAPGLRGGVFCAFRAALAIREWAL